MATNIPFCYDKTINLVQEKQELYTVFDICLQTKAVLKKKKMKSIGTERECQGRWVNHPVSMVFLLT